MTAQPTPPTPPAPAPAPTPIPAAKTIYINYFDAITDEKVKALMGIISELIARQRPSALCFLLSSPGGSVNAGIVLYNFLRALPVEIIMHNTGSVDSIGTIVFLAGAKRYAAQHCSFLFHGVAANFPQTTRLSHPQMVERLSSLKESENKIAGIISHNTSLTESDVRGLFHQGESKNVAFAKEKGIIHEIRDPLIPKDAPFITVNLN